MVSCSSSSSRSSNSEIYIVEEIGTSREDNNSDRA